MPPLAAVAIGAGSALAPVAAALAPALPFVSAGVGIYGAVQSTRQAEKARSDAESQFRRQMVFTEKQAGEYYQLSTQQMELQSQASQIKTLANLIGTRQPAAPQVFTLPPAREYGVVARINQAIDKMLRG